MSHTILLIVLAAASQTRGAIPVRQPASVGIRVTDRAGAPVDAARVTVHGPAEREGGTDTSGFVTFINMKPGTYLLRVERAAFVTLEKEFTVVQGRAATVNVVLSPSDQRTTAAAAIAVGNPHVLSIPDFAERELIRQEPTKESPIGCSGATQARLIQVREPLVTHSHADTEETLYVVAGEAMLKIGEERRRVAPGWLCIVPRRTSHSLTRLGKNPVIVVSVLSGQACPQPAAPGRVITYEK